MNPESVTRAEQKWLQRALVVIRFIRDPAFPGIVVMILVTALGFGGLFLGWRAAARTLHVALQTPAFVSGALGGIALIGMGLALLIVQLDRRDAAREQKLTDDLLDEIADLMVAAPHLRKKI